MTAERQPLSKRLRVAISIFLVGHLLAVFLPPLSFQTRGPLGPSPSIATAFAAVEPYSQFLYIDRGYAFFAPNPGPSHLIRAAVTDRDGQQVDEVLYPDLQQQWPRLLYHRHFMLTEFLDRIYQPPGPPAELVQLDRDAAEMWVRERARYEHVRQSVVEHLKHENPGKEVAIQRIEHLIPDVIEFQREPIALNDERLYLILRDQPVDVAAPGDLAAPAGPAETIPPPPGAVAEAKANAQDSDDPDSVGETEKEADEEIDGQPDENGPEEDKSDKQTPEQSPNEATSDEGGLS